MDRLRCWHARGPRPGYPQSVVCPRRPFGSCGQPPSFGASALVLRIRNSVPPDLAAHRHAVDRGRHPDQADVMWERAVPSRRGTGLS